MAKGYVAIILHAHLPYVRDLSPDGALEEDWLYEAIIETYVPLIKVLERLEAERLPKVGSIAHTTPFEYAFRLCTYATLQKEAGCAH